MADHLDLQPAGETPLKTLTEITMKVDLDKFKELSKQVSTLRVTLDESAVPLFEKTLAARGKKITLDTQQVNHAAQRMMHAAHALEIFSDLVGKMGNAVVEKG